MAKKHQHEVGENLDLLAGVTALRRLAMAETLIRYYENFGTPSNNFRENLAVAKEWKRLLMAPAITQSELDEFLVQLHSDKLHHGTAWEEMLMYVEKWWEQRGSGRADSAGDMDRQLLYRELF